jgi:uridine kinase
LDSWAETIALRAIGLRADLERGVSVGISGVDCAGKSTLAEAVFEWLTKEDVRVVLVPGDEFTRPERERYACGDEGLAYYRDSFDYQDLFDKVLPAVRSSAHGSVQIRSTDWERDTWKERELALPPRAVVLVEGCFLFADGRASCFDLSVWLDLPLERVIPRALQRPRDLQRMGGPDGVRSRYSVRYIPGQLLHLGRDRPRAQAHLVLEAE